MIRLLGDSQVISEPCSDGLALLDTTTGDCTFLDRVGAQMWQALRLSATTGEAIDRLHARFGVDRRILRADLRVFAEFLMASGLATSGADADSTDSVDAVGQVRGDGRLPELDPQVREDQGHPPDSEALVAAPRIMCARRLLESVLVTGIVGDAVLLDAPSQVVEAVRDVLEAEAATDRRVSKIDGSAVRDVQDASDDVCLLWVQARHVRQATRALDLWLARVVTGGYVVVSGLEPPAMRDVFAGRAPDVGPAVPIDWWTQWWQR